MAENQETIQNGPEDPRRLIRNGAAPNKVEETLVNERRDLLDVVAVEHVSGITTGIKAIVSLDVMNKRDDVACKDEQERNDT